MNDFSSRCLLHEWLLSKCLLHEWLLSRCLLHEWVFIQMFITWMTFIQMFNTWMTFIQMFTTWMSFYTDIYYVNDCLAIKIASTIIGPIAFKNKKETKHSNIFHK